MKTALIIFLTLLTPLCVTGQENNLYQQFSNENTPRTLVYLQTDKGVYQPGEEIRFKGYVMHSQFLFPAILDTTLYIQLLAPGSNEIIHQEKLYIQDGFSEGYITIKKSVPSGNYTLAAFTRESFGNDTSEFKTCRSVRIWKGEPQERAWNSVTEKIVQVSFMPEGGNLVAGIMNTVAFKACLPSGIPVDFEGILYEDDTPLADLKSTHKGMGKFLFIPLAGKKYAVKEAGSNIQHSLPEIQSNGVVLKKVRQTQKQITFLAVKTPETPLGKVFVSAKIRGVVYGVYQGLFQQDSLVLNLPTAALPQGIMEFTLYNSDLMPLAERLVYVNADQNVILTTTLSKSVYREKEKVTLKIKTEDNKGNPVVAHLGLSVYDQFFKNSADRLNIVSYSHLFTQIRGNIADPAYYFDQKNADRLESLDLLLMTQGWRRYVYSSREAQRYSGYIPNLLSGRVQSKKMLPTMLLTFMPNNSGFGNPVDVTKEGIFRLGIENMLLGNFYIKPLGNEEISQNAKITFTDAFEIINDILSRKQVIYPTTSSGPDSPDIPKLRWKPDIITDEKGEAIVEFYTSDLEGEFIGNIEGLTGSGLLGAANFSFQVINPQK